YVRSGFASGPLRDEGHVHFDRADGGREHLLARGADGRPVRDTPAPLRQVASHGGGGSARKTGPFGPRGHFGNRVGGSRCDDPRTDDGPPSRKHSPASS